VVIDVSTEAMNTEEFSDKNSVFTEEEVIDRVDRP
jgi:hypothetical protein